MTIDQAVTKTTAVKQSRKVRFQIIVAALLVAAVVFGLYSRITHAPSQTREPVAAAPANDTLVIPPAAGATKITNGVPVGYPRTKAGATAAATNYLTTLYGSTAVLGKDGGKIIATVAVPGQEASLTKQLAPGIEGARTALGLDNNGNVEAGQTTAYRMAPLGYNVDAYDNNTATLTVWWVGVIGVAAEQTTFPVMAVWGTDKVTLTWAGNDWKWAESKHTDGPAPFQGTDPAKTDDLAKRLATQPYGYGR